MKLIIGNKNYSSWSLRPWLLLTMHAVPFEEIRIPLDRPDTQRELANFTDAGKVPVLHDGELVVWDSLAICEYVSERYLNGKGWPADSHARAQARSCSAEMHSGFFQLREKLPMNCRAVGREVAITPALEAEITRIERLWSRLRETHKDQGPWLFGTFSIADCMFAPVIFRFHTYGVSITDRSAEYMQHFLHNVQMQRWLRQAGEEPEIIAAAEVGIPCCG